MLSTFRLGRATYLLSATVITAVCVGIVPADPGQHVLGQAFPLALSAYAQSSAISVITDLNVYPEPPLPSLPAAGSTTVDPTFGSTILRVTDANDSADGCGTTYSSKPMLNYNNTRIAAACLVGFTRFKVFDFNPTTMVRSNGRIQANPPSGFQEYGSIWSHTDPSKYYSCAGRSLYEITIAASGTTWTNTLVRDFAAQIGGTSAGYCTQISMSENNDVFAFHYVGSTAIGFIAYRRSTNTVLLQVVGGSTIGGGTVLDEVEIDKSGRYLVVCCNPSHVYDLQAVPITNTTVTNQDFIHRAMGNGMLVAHGTSNNLLKRNLATPNTVTTILSTGWSYSNTQDHYSLTGSDTWFMSCRYNTNGQLVTKVYDQECLEVNTTGDQAVRRHVHHRSKIYNNDYDVQPKGSVSYDGRFIAFTSNWGNANGRRDVYIVQIPPAPGSGDVTPPAVPTNLRVQ